MDGTQYTLTPSSVSWEELTGRRVLYSQERVIVTTVYTTMTAGTPTLISQ